MATLTVPARIEALASVNTFLEENVPLSFQKVFPKLRLAAEELLVNIFSHAYAETTGEVQLELHLMRHGEVESLIFKTIDWGPPFNPFEAPPPDLDLDADLRPIGGLGIHIIKSVSDRYVYDRRYNANIVELCFEKTP